MDVPALYRRSHSHLRVKNSRIFFNTGSSPPCRADEIPDVRRGSHPRREPRAALRAARSSASGNGRSPVAKQHHLAITR